jgi:hypothetical protein
MKFGVNSSSSMPLHARKRLSRVKQVPQLRDRWLEHVNENEHALPEPAGKYEVCRQIEAAHRTAPPVAQIAA